ncbi:hypothetical protein ACERNI_03535 [Camelimonas sp. ID_303_24]
MRIIAEHDVNVPQPLLFSVAASREASRITPTACLFRMAASPVKPLQPSLPGIWQQTWQQTWQERRQQKPARQPARQPASRKDRLVPGEYGEGRAQAAAFPGCFF